MAAVTLAGIAVLVGDDITALVGGNFCNGIAVFPHAALCLLDYDGCTDGK